MGYGNPLFDGDEPLAANSRQRVLSMRLFFHGLRPRTKDEGSGLQGRDRDQDGERDNSRSQHGEPPGERGNRS
jgi:hypothetical protein